MTCTTAPDWRSALTGSVSSTCSTPSVARTAILCPASSWAMITSFCLLRLLGPNASAPSTFLFLTSALREPHNCTEFFDARNETDGSAQKTSASVHDQE